MPSLRTARAAALLLFVFVAVAALPPGGAPRADAAESVTAVSAGAQHTCAITTGGAAFCWGSNDYGQLGDGTLTDREVPTEVVGLLDASAVDAGARHTCAIATGGAVFCWGGNAYGQLGDGTLTPRETPTEVVGLQDAVAVAAGEQHTCAIAASGAVMCWGDNSQGQLGDATACGTICTQPVVAVGLGTGGVSVVAGWAHSCALTMDGAVRCWGNNFHGQIGNNQVGNTLSTPALVALGDGAQLIAAGDWHSCAVTDGGAAKCWGENIHGQIGNGVSGVNQLVPAGVVGLGSNVAAIAGGERHGCAVTSSGALSCWGDNAQGQLGDGTTNGSTTAVDIVVAASVGGVAELPRKSVPVDPSAGSDTIPRLQIGLAVAALAPAFALASAVLLLRRRRAG